MPVSAPPPSLTALVVAHNEEWQLDACLATLTFANAIVVVLDKCTDRSKAIALSHGAHLVEGAWEIEGARRNAGIAACSSDWILEVDADERITPELAAEIRQVIATSPAAYHTLPVDNYIGARLVRHGWGGSFGKNTAAALFRKDAKHWGAQRVHPRLTWRGEKGATLRHPLIHYVDRDLSDTLQRLNSYSTQHARDLVDAGNIGTLRGNVRRLFSRFWKCYVARKGWREGGHGLVIALCAGLYPLLSYVKACDLRAATTRHHDRPTP